MNYQRIITIAALFIVSGTIFPGSCIPKELPHRPHGASSQHQPRQTRENNTSAHERKNSNSSAGKESHKRFARGYRKNRAF